MEEQVFEYDIETALKGGYDHFMLKEIYEQPEVLDKTIHEYLKDGGVIGATWFN